METPLILGLAFRNLGRNLRRTLIAKASVAFGVFAAVMAWTLIDGMQLAWAKFEVESNTGAFQVEHDRYRELRKSSPLAVTLADSDTLVQRIAATPGVRAAYGKLEFPGMVSSGIKATFFDGVAADPELQAHTLFRQQNLIVAGKPLSGHPGEVVLGSDLASMLGVKIGDPIAVVVRTFHGNMNLGQATLVGTKNGLHFPSSTYLEMPLREAQSLLRAPDRVSGIVAITREIEQTPQAMARVSALLAHEQRAARLRGYPELIPVYAHAIALFKAITVVVGAALLVLATAGVGSVMSMAVVERQREIGTLLALGMERHAVRHMFLVEGAVTGALGAASGLVLVGLAQAALALRGGLQFATGGAKGQAIAVMPLASATVLALAVVVPALVAMASAWWPAARASRLTAVEALRDAPA